VKQRETAQRGLAEEFFQAVRDLHEEGKGRPYLMEIRRQMLANRAAEAGAIGRLAQRAGVTLGFSLKDSELEMARVSLEERGRLESAMEAQIDHQPARLLVYLPEDVSAAESA
jgi:hypothetical protein